MGRYYKLDKKGKTSNLDVGSYEMPEGGSQYKENTPSFESLHAGNAGRGVQGMPNYKVGAQEYDRNKKPDKKYAKGGYVKSADGIAQRGKTKGRMC